MLHNLNPQIDAYIKKAAPFAIPILEHIRKLIHQANPEVQECIKWSFASFDFKGPICSIAAFKKHVAFGFWKTALINDPKGYLKERKINGGEAMGNFGRITSVKDLPADKIIIDFVKQACKLNEQGIKLPSTSKVVLKEIETPDYILAALKENKKSMQTFLAFSNSNKKEYVEWITEAKTEKTKMNRLETAVQWMSEGKIRNWKYLKKD